LDGALRGRARDGRADRGDEDLVRVPRRIARSGDGAAPLRPAAGAARRTGAVHRARRRRVRRWSTHPGGGRDMRWLRRRLGGGVPERAALPEPELVRALLDEAVGLPALAPSRALLGRLADDYARTRALAARPLRIALVGSTGAGKSTLLNALAG